MSKNVHVIVATGEWGQDHLKYRRHRLAEFLSSRPETKEVIWVCPSPNQPHEVFTILENGIKQYIISDINPNKLFRFGRYFDAFYRQKLNFLHDYLKQTFPKNDLYLWYTFPGFPGVANIVDWKKVSYDCSDLWASSISGNKNIVLLLREKSILQAERRISKRADTITCTSDYLFESLTQRFNITKNIYVLENGVEYSLFEHIADRSFKEARTDENVVLGFIGGIKPKLDFSLLQLMLKKKKNWKLLLVGPDGTNGDPSFRQLLTLNNVTWTDKVPPSDVPLYMEKIDIGILPYKSSEYNNAVFPLKLFEFLGAGKPVVGMNLPSTQKFAEPDVYHYVSSKRTEDFIEECEELLKTLKNTALVKRRRNLAKEQDWNNIFNNMYRIVMGF